MDGVYRSHLGSVSIEYIGSICTPCRRGRSNCLVRDLVAAAAVERAVAVVADASATEEDLCESHQAGLFEQYSAFDKSQV